LSRTFDSEQLNQAFYPAAIAAFCEPQEKEGIFMKLHSSEAFREFAKAFTGRWIAGDTGISEATHSVFQDIGGHECGGHDSGGGDGTD